MEYIRVEEALASVRANMNEALWNLCHIEDWDPEVDDWYFTKPMRRAIKQAFTTLLLLSEALGLPNFREMVAREYKEAKELGNGLSEIIVDPDGDLHLLVESRIDRLLGAFQALVGLRVEKVMCKTIELTDVLRNCEYSLYRDNQLAAPANETELHRRIESILSCVYPDLKHKPSIATPIKNFEPDTGIPSARALIEYKYVGNAEDMKRVSDEILADTQGYSSRDWNSFIYLIYETRHFQPESKWQQQMITSGNPMNTKVVIICEEQPTSRRAKKASSARMIKGGSSSRLAKRKKT